MFNNQLWPLKHQIHNDKSVSVVSDLFRINCRNANTLFSQFVSNNAVFYSGDNHLFGTTA